MSQTEPNNSLLKPFPALTRNNQTTSITPDMDFREVIESAPEYSTIIVQPGEYMESIRVTKPLHFQANGKVTLSSEGTNECIIISSPLVSFSGFLIEQKQSKIRGAIKVINGAAIFQNCIIKTKAMPTIVVQNDSLVQIKSCKVYGAKGASLQLSSQSQVESFDSLFSDSLTSIVTLTNKAVGYFSRCTFNESPKGGITISESSLILIETSTFNHCNFELRSDNTKCRIDNCTFSQESQISLFNYSGISFTKNSLNNSSIQMGGNSSAMFSSNRYNSSYLILYGSTAATFENEAFTGSAESSIRIMDSSKCVLKKSSFSSIDGYGIIIYGESDLTLENIQIGKITKNAVFCHSGCTVRISNMTAKDLDCTPIICNSINQITLSDVRIENCNGNGCEIHDSKCEVKIKDCVYQSNKKCGLILSNINNGAAVEKCTFASNSFSGLHCCGTPLQVDGSNFHQNGKGGIHLSQSSRGVVNGTTFTNNSWPAIYCDSSSQIDVTSCAFTNNSTAVNIEGGGKITSCKFVQNIQNAAVQVTGNATLSSVEFSNNKCPLYVDASGNVSVSNSSFAASERHLELCQNAVCKCDECKFEQASGDAALCVNGNSSLTLVKCSVTQSRLVAISTEGNTSISESVVTNAGKVGLMCNPGATGEISGNEFSNNGETSILCVDGTPKIFNNTITNNKKFGIYISSKDSPSVENNTFSLNHLAHIWRSD